MTNKLSNLFSNITHRFNLLNNSTTIQEQLTNQLLKNTLAFKRQVQHDSILNTLTVNFI